MKDHSIMLGKEYEIVKNPKNPEHGFSFRGRIKDAIEVVKEGKGDLVITDLCISDEPPVAAGTFYREAVVRFLDREYGEQERRKFLEGIEHQEIVYKYIIILDNGTKLFKDQERVKYFSSEKEAEEFAEANKISNFEIAQAI